MSGNGSDRGDVTVRRAHATDLDGLADVLVDCVHGGASVSFLLPFDRERALAFWRDVLTSAERGERVVLVAVDGTGVVGTVQVVPATTENQPHRADIAKLLTHRRARRRGVGEALMLAADDEARALGRDVLVLDTASADAERLYERLGWQRVGVVPEYALLPGGGRCDTVFFCKRLA